MVIVTLLRADLCVEFTMADEALALSPISARAAMPSEVDYDAIREAFMETSRGRWFLGEYTKRNRNADTHMVLDAVARIEESLATLRQPEVENQVPKVLAAIRDAIEQAEAAADAALDRAVLVESLGLVHRGIGVIEEITWRWREVGADDQICKLIDSQLAAIEEACRQISAIDPLPELKGAFNLLKQRIEQANAVSSPTPVKASVDVGDGDLTMVDEPPVDAAADAEDEAVLDVVALEMGAPDPEFDDKFDVPSPLTVEPAGPVASEPEPKVDTEPAAIAVAPAESPNPATAVTWPVTAPSLQPAPQLSPSSITVASETLQTPRTPADDPLEPIRRMTQAEKIALFS